MILSPRAKLVLLASLFALPMVASFTVYRFFPPEPAANYGELLLPPRSLSAEFRRPLGDQWLLLALEEPPCEALCRERITAIRQVRLALGRDASRVEAVSRSRAEFERAGLVVDPDHVYLADPHGNVMMRWPATPDLKRMLGDLKRLLKASQIG